MHQRLAAMPLVLLVLLAVAGAGTLFPNSASATPTLVIDAETGEKLPRVWPRREDGEVMHLSEISLRRAKNAPRKNWVESNGEEQC